MRIECRYSTRCSLEYSVCFTLLINYSLLYLSSPYVLPALYRLEFFWFALSALPTPPPHLTPRPYLPFMSSVSTYPSQGRNKGGSFLWHPGVCMVSCCVLHISSEECRLCVVRVSCGPLPNRTGIP